MDDVQKMLRAIINGQSSFRQEVVNKIEKLDQKVDEVSERLEKKIDGVEENMTQRMDKIGKQLAYLEDDTPTTQEYNKLEKRVAKIYQKLSIDQFSA